MKSGLFLWHHIEHVQICIKMLYFTSSFKMCAFLLFLPWVLTVNKWAMTNANHGQILGLGVIIQICKTPSRINTTHRHTQQNCAKMCAVKNSWKSPDRGYWSGKIMIGMFRKRFGNQVSTKRKLIPILWSDRILFWSDRMNVQHM